jgi:hypothetical protein
MRSRKQIEEFFLVTKKLYFPNKSVFNSRFMMQIFMGLKKLLPAGSKGSYNIPQLKRDDSFSKTRIFEIINANPNLRQYIPDQANAKHLDRNFLLAVLFHEDHGAWMDLYQQYKIKRSIVGVNPLATTNLRVLPEFLNDLQTFQSYSRVRGRDRFIRYAGNNDLFHNHNAGLGNLNVGIGGEPEMELNETRISIPGDAEEVNMQENEEINQDKNLLNFINNPRINAEEYKLQYEYLRNLVGQVFEEEKEKSPQLKNNVDNFDALGIEIVQELIANQHNYELSGKDNDYIKNVIRHILEIRLS